MREFTASLSESDAITVGLMVDARLRILGIRYAPVGSRRYCVVEDRVVADIVGLGLDLWEIRAQIEEAQAEAKYTNG